MNLNIIPEDQGRECGFGEYGVTVVPNYFVALKDGTRLAVRFWCPESTAPQAWFGGAPSYPLYRVTEGAGREEESFPVVMEYIPYRKSDLTAERDYRRHVWLASHGYVIARVDMRGSGDSDGFLLDEYLQQEQDDACEIIQWFADQSWCNGKVGMYGKSWGGFNGLQLAYERPPALRAVVSVYTSDDRYMTDVHHEGGCLLGSEIIAWGWRVMIYNCVPPNPAVREDWEAVWRERLEQVTPWATRWISHTTRDDYWLHGSVSKDYSRLEGCPILVIGGWNDGYFNTVFRLLENVKSAKGIVGPWSHQWPDIAIPGPHMEYMEECLRWWDHNLKGIDNKAESLPKLRVYIQESLTKHPLPGVTIPGKWLGLPQWPCEGATNTTMFPSRSGVLLLHTEKHTEWQSAYFNAGCSMTGTAEWCNSSYAGEGPYDQRQDDSYSLTWDTQPLQQPITILGKPELTIKFRVSSSKSSQLIVRLCNVFPDGQSRYITRGIINLNHIRGHGPGQQEKLHPGTEYDVTIPFSYAGYTVPGGNKLRLAMSPSYFPITWPACSPEPVDIQVGEGLTRLSLPLVTIAEEMMVKGNELAHMMTETPKLAPPMPMEERRPDGDPCYKVVTSYQPALGVHKRTVDLDDGSYMHKQSGITINTLPAHEEATITEGDPLSAKYTAEAGVEGSWPDQSGGMVNATIHVHSEMSSTEDEMILVNHVDICKENETFFKRSWNHRIKRE